MTPHEETTPATTERTLFAEVQRIGAALDNLTKAVQMRFDTVDDGISDVLDELQQIKMRVETIEKETEAIEREISPPPAVRLVLSLGTTIPQ